MAIVNQIALESNRKFQIRFDGGQLSSDAGLFLLKEFYHKLGVEQLLKDRFHTNDSGRFRIHEDHKNLLQMLFQITSAYFQDDHADALRNDPVFTALLGKPALASQPTLSRFHNRMDETTYGQLEEIQRLLRKKIYSVKKPEHILFDLDTTLFSTYGEQEGKAFNYHYQADGYHPLLCYDGMTGDLLKAELRPGGTYCGKDAVAFMQPLLEEYANSYPNVGLFLRGDSGFMDNKLFTLCETNGTTYVIRMKTNPVLKKLAAEAERELFARTREDGISYAAVYTEFLYQAGPWEYPRRIVCKIEKLYGKIDHEYAFLATNMTSSPEDVCRFYFKRGQMENFIKECKSGFDMDYVSSSSQIVNANRMQIHALAYNLFNWFRRLVLPNHLKKDRINTIRLKLFKIAARVVRSSRYVYFKLCSSCPFQKEFFETIQNIRILRLLE